MSLPIERINSKLEGEFTFRGKKWSVPFTVTGDGVQFRIKRKGRKLSLEVVHIEVNEESRKSLPLIQPFCPHFSLCGGCRAQHLSYDFQIKMKSQAVSEAMEKEFSVIPEILPAPSLTGYRHRMDFAVDGSSIGLHPPGDFSKIVNIESCPVQSDTANSILKALRRTLEEHEGIAFRREDGSGLIKYATIRTGITGALILTCDKNNLSRDEDRFRIFADVLANNIKSETKDSISLIVTDSEEGSELSCTSGGSSFHGEASFSIELGEKEFKIPYDSFFQPNPVCFTGLLKWSVDALLKKKDLFTRGNLLDFYSGSGILSSILMEKLKPDIADKITGIRGYDFILSSVEDAKNYFDDSKNTEFHAKDLNAGFTPEENPFAEPVSLIIADPPRAGLSPKLIKAILENSEAPLFLYISCNPESQIRDLNSLKDKYRPAAACIADCFPHTGHLEQAVLLLKSD